MNNKLLQVYQNLAQEEKLRRNARNDILAFTKYTKPDYIVNWHHREIGELLNKMLEGYIQNAIIQAPPRYGKTEIASRRFIPLYLGRNPDNNVIGTTYNDTISQDTNRDIQRVFDSHKYKNLFPDVGLREAGIKNTGNTKCFRTLNRLDIVGHKGSYRNCGIQGGITSRGANLFVIDDYCKNYKESRSKSIKKGVWNEFLATIQTRMEGLKQIIVFATRWADDDLIGRIIKSSKRKWEVLKFEALKSSKTYHYDKRTEGQPLWTLRDTEEELLEKQEADGLIFNALYQQDPPSVGGLIFKKVWFKYFDNLPAGPYTIIQSWDTAFKVGQGNDFNVCSTWYKFIDGFYLVDVFRKRLTYPGLKKSALELAASKKPNIILVEDKASGQSLIQDLRESTSLPILPRSADIDKIARANSTTGLFESGRVYFYNFGKWLYDLEDELKDFGEGCDYDDQVDSVTQALNYMKQGNINFDINVGESQCDEEW